MGEGLDLNKGDTLPKLLLNRARGPKREKPAIREKDYGIWQCYNWLDYLDNVKRFALGLSSLGLKRGDTLAVIGDNRPQGYWAQVAAMCLGAIPIPLYQDAIEKELEYILIHSEAKYVFAEDQEQVDKVLALKDRVPTIESIIYDNPKGLTNYTETFLKSFNHVQELGVSFEREFMDFFEQEVLKSSPEDTALIVYTSGTTGYPKGVVLTHSNLLSNVRCLSKVEQYRNSDEVMAYLPMAWVGDVVTSIVMSLEIGFTINCPESASSVMRDMRQVGPSIMLCPPRIWENMLTQVQIKMEDASWPKKKLYKLFMDIAEEVYNKRQHHNPFPAKLRILYYFGNLIIFRPLRDNLGMGKVRYAYTGGAPLGPEVFRFYRSIGVNLKQAYGLTETSSVFTYQPDDDVRIETVGLPAPGIDVKISEEGEVLVKGPGVFHEYYKNPQMTSQAFLEGWFRTGDAGIMDEDGYLKIIDRAKDVSKLAGGATFSPAYIENKLKFSPYIKEAVAFGQGRDFVVAIINVDLGTVGNWAEKRSLSYTSYTDLSQKPEVYEMIHKEVKRVNHSLFKEEPLRLTQIKKYLILHKELDPDDAEITRTRKLRRRFISEKYADIVEAIYSGETVIDVETKIIYEDGEGKIVKAHLKIQEVEFYHEADSVAGD